MSSKRIDPHEIAFDARRRQHPNAGRGHRDAASHAHRRRRNSAGREAAARRPAHEIRREPEPAARGAFAALRRGLRGGDGKPARIPRGAGLRAQPAGGDAASRGARELRAAGVDRARRRPLGGRGGPEPPPPGQARARRPRRPAPGGLGARPPRLPPEPAFGVPHAAAAQLLRDAPRSERPLPAPLSREQPDRPRRHAGAPQHLRRDARAPRRAGPLAPARPHRAHRAARPWRARREARHVRRAGRLTAHPSDSSVYAPHISDITDRRRTMSFSINRNTVARTAAGAAALLFSLGALAQEFPSKPIRWVVPFSAGGPADIFARTIQPKLAEALGQPVIIENKAGGRSNIGHSDVARSEPDGYTILYVVPNIVTNPSLFRNMVDPLKEVAPVTRITAQSYVLVANKDFAPKTVAEIIAQAKAK